MADIQLSGSVGAGGAFPILGRADAEIVGDANLVLDLDQYSNYFVRVTSDGASTGVRSVVVPLTKGVTFLVQNATSEGFAVLVIGASGAGVLVEPGDTALVATDGVNYGAPSAPGALGKTTKGQTTWQNDGTDGVIVPAGTTVDLYTVAPPIAEGETIVIAVTTDIQSFISSDFGSRSARMSVRKISGVVQTADGGSSDSNVTVPPAPNDVGTSLESAVTEIRIDGTDLKVSTTAPTDVPMFAGTSVSMVRRLQHSEPSPLPASITPNFDTNTATPSVTIAGVGFGGATGAGVKVGATKYPLASFVLTGTTTITGVLPAAAISKGFVYVTISGVDFVSTVPFWFLAAGGPSSDVAITPLSGPTGGGTSIAVTATSGLVGLDIPGFGVTFGAGNFATSVVVPNDANATCKTPAGSGSVTVTVSTPNGTRTLATPYVFLSPLTIWPTQLLFYYKWDHATLVSTKVAALTDLSGNGLDASQSNPALQPVHNASGGGNNQGSWSGQINTLLQSIATSLAQPLRIFIIARSVTETTQGRLVDLGLNANAVIQEIAEMVAFNVSTAGPQVAIVNGQDFFLDVLFDGASSTIAVNGGTPVAAALPGTGSTAVPVTLGNFGGGGDNGAIANYYEIWATDETTPSTGTQLSEALAYAQGGYDTP